MNHHTIIYVVKKMIYQMTFPLIYLLIIHKFYELL